MSQNLRINGVDYPGVPAIVVPKTAGGSASFLDTADATATAGDIVSGKTAYAGGVKITGTGSGGSGGDYNVVSTENPDGTQNLAISDAGGSIQIEALEVTANGSYTAPAGSAYSPVSVQVTPDLQTKSLTASANGTYTLTPDLGKALSAATVTVAIPTYDGTVS